MTENHKRPPHKGAGHRGRLRDRFLKSGLDGFHDYEVIELLLTLGTPRKDCKAPAKAALSRFKTLQGVLEATPADLCQLPGIGPINLFGLKLITAVSRRYLRQRLEGKTPLTNSRELFDYLNHTIRDRKRECFVAIYLDAKNRVIADEVLFTGTLTASAVYPREVVQAALAHTAAAVIFAHNHPSGDPAPSPDDMAITRKLVHACALMGITVHEHLIIGTEGYFSFADHGHMARISAEEKSL
ncbi:DNA repair protein RadC [Desulfosarcina alkanivorans]|uniref:DNA repair protein RadC n=1 Tax=Desulfosarcina alkanivorans TaxID=571177 RepID=A0A5K7Z1B3_9BACT|nr:DNA repair protein RadC [Desulfosarcina alkanivorans]BBO72274.1 DNA repair protein RadC [Desulfosarcina alkanivorans]